MSKNKTSKAKPKILYGVIARLIIIAAVIGCFVSVIVMQSERADMEKQLQTIKNKAEEVQAENVELQRILDGGDIDAYMEKIAIEKMNYAYPNERRYYDTSRN